MPYMCWYDPPEASKKIIKNLCQQIVDEVKELRKNGDPIGLGLRDVKELLNHLYDAPSCNEKK
jgi:hypothetical protein